MSAWYPRREAFLAEVIDAGRPIFQGDIFRGVPTAFLGHPAAGAAAFAMKPAPTPEGAECALTPEEIRAVAVIAGSYTMVLPHPCDFSTGEKGDTHTVRQVARLTRIADTRLARKHVEGGRVNHTVMGARVGLRAPRRRLAARPAHHHGSRLGLPQPRPAGWPY